MESDYPLVFVDAGPNLPNTRVLTVNKGEGIRMAVHTSPFFTINALFAVCSGSFYRTLGDSSARRISFLLLGLKCPASTFSPSSAMELRNASRRAIAEGR